MPNTDKIYVILMTGLETSIDSQGQATLFLDGYGEDEGLLYFSQVELPKLLVAIKKHPDVPIVLYSYAGKFAPQVAKVVQDKSRIFVIEPWVGSSGRLQGAIDTITEGVPSTNYQVGPSAARGKGVPNASQTPSGFSHFQALTYAGEVIRSKYPPAPPPPPTNDITFKAFVTAPDEFNPGQQEGIVGANIKISRNGNQVTGLVTPVGGEISETKKLEVGTYEIEISFTGYDTQTLTKQVTSTTKEINLGNVKLIENSELLNEVEVVSETFIGTVVDKKTKEKIAGAVIQSSITGSSDGKIQQTRSKSGNNIGEFVLGLQLNQVTLFSDGSSKSTRVDDKITVVVSAEGYSSSSPIQLVKGDGTLKKDLRIIPLEPLQDKVEEEIVSNKNLTDTQKDIIEGFSGKDFISSLLKKIFRTIQDRLIPFILKQIAAFGVAEFNEQVIKNIDELPKVCPSNIENLNKLIKKKNDLTKQLNNLYKSINLINKFLDIPPITIPVAEAAVISAKVYVAASAFIPSTVATPNPVGPILIVKDLIDKFEDLIDILKNKLGVGTLQLRVIIEELRKALLLLDILDALIQTCTEELTQDDNGNIQNQTPISPQLLASTQQQSQQLSPVVTNVNGFDMSVITEDGETEFDLKRRRAVAKNKAGIIMLKGELSFSSNDQILIDELVFYIQQNDLKAE